MPDPTGPGERSERGREVAKEDAGSRESRGRAASGQAVERALEIEPGVELHAGEDAGQVPRDDDA
jgi:hypothetical protein